MNSVFSSKRRPVYQRKNEAILSTMADLRIATASTDLVGASLPNRAKLLSIVLLGSSMLTAFSLTNREGVLFDGLPNLFPGIPNQNTRVPIFPIGDDAIVFIQTSNSVRIKNVYLSLER